MKNKFFYILITLFYSSQALANTPIIQELEKLRNSLSIKDSSRGELTLRLADLYFYDAVEKIKNANLSPSSSDFDKKLKEAEKSRRRALSLYKEGVQGREKGLQTKIFFQMAQIYNELGEAHEAKSLWINLAAQDSIPQIKAEALLRLAQALEVSGNKNDLATAEKYYRTAIQFCNERDTCSFIHYRLAWILKSKGDYKNSFLEIQEALWDSRANIQEEVLRDYLLFISEGEENASTALAWVDPLALKLNRPELLLQLAENYFSNGKKPAAVQILRLVNDRNPKLNYEIRLLEEYYGQRNWEEFQNILTLLQERIIKNNIIASSEELENSEKILRRLVIQLDAERISQAKHLSSFQESAMLYLKLYPRKDASFRIMESWLNAETDFQKKKAQTQEWLRNAQTVFQLKTEQELRLHELLAEVAQKTNDIELLLVEMRELEKRHTNIEKKRNSKYVYARTLYESKRYAEALVEFQDLALFQSLPSPDKWAIQSQNLALDILNQQKNYVAIQKQAELWTKNKNISKNNTLEKELNHMNEVASAAIFEQTVAEGNTPNALEKFFQNCKQKLFLPKSCDNAKSIAIQLNDQKTIIAIAELEGKKDDLLALYEVAGHFAKAAALLEKEYSASSLKWQPSTAFKIALLYELDGKTSDRNRWLASLIQYYKKNGGLEKDENLLWQTLVDTNMASIDHLALPWSSSKKEEIAAYFENKGLSTPVTKNILLSSKTSLGKAWSFYILQQVYSMDKDQRKIDFYGKNSKATFQKRIAKLQGLEQFIHRYLEGADRETRVLLLLTAIQAQHDLSQEVMATPIPDGLDDATLAQVKTSLSELAKPFFDKAEIYTNLCSEQIAKLESSELSKKYSDLLHSKNYQAMAKEFLSLQPGQETIKKSSWEYSAINPFLEKLRSETKSEMALQGLKDFFTTQDQKRLASYFEGRLRQLKKEAI